jgi:parallel beta-helix repeat protein
MKTMQQKNMWKAAIAVAVALAFVLPGSAAFANMETIGITSKSEKIENTVLNENIDGEPFPPLYHHYFYGAIRVNGSPAPIGTKVNARGPSPIQNGTNNPRYTTQVGYYGIPDPKLDCAGVNAPDGLIITFWINDQPSGEFYVFKRFGTTMLNLTIGENDPPYVPSNPYPADGLTGLPLNITLSWTGGDPDGDPVTYDVYFGNTTQPPQVAWNQSGTTYYPGVLEQKTLYCWKIVAWDNQSASTIGPTWRFMTFGPSAVAFVDDDRPPEWYDHWHVHTIQEGIDNCSTSEFDTVYVYPGLYREHVTVNKQVMMSGVSNETVIIDGGGTGTVVSVLKSMINISGFTMMNGTDGILFSNAIPYVHNVTIRDCNVFGNTRTGIDISRSTDCHVINCSVHDNVNIVGLTTVGIGIYLLACDRCEVIGCTVYNNSGSNVPGTPSPLYSGVGIYLAAATSCTLQNNIIYGNQYNFRTVGNNVVYYETHNIDTSNTVNGKPIYYIINENDRVIDGEVTNIGTIVLVRCDNVTVKNVETSNSGSGIQLIGTWNSTIMDCTFSDNVYGAWFYVRSAYNRIMNCSLFGNNNVEGIGVRTQDDSSFNEVINCTIYDNYQLGYWSQGTLNNSIIGCNIYNNGLAGLSLYYGGIRFDYKTDHNLVEDCRVYNNWVGINTYSYCIGQTIKNSEIYNNHKSGLYIGGPQHSIVNCDFYNNTEYGIYITGSLADSSVIHHNNFGNNYIKNAYDSRTNQWDNGTVGNYWDDYTGIDANGDGIGDTPYNISGKTIPNQDHYPLMLPLDNIPPVITDVNATPEVQNTTLPVNITCTVTDNWDLIDTVKINISGPEGFTLEATMNEGSYYYENIYMTMGVYFYYIWANDTSGNIAVSDTYSFVIIEFDQPTSAVNPLPLWKKTIPFAITATAYDNTGVANVTLWSRYSSTGTTWTNWTFYGTDEDAPWSWSFTGSDGYYQFYSIAIDDYGNIEDTPSAYDASTGVDTTKPVTTIGLTGTMGGNNWYTSIVTVTLSATDTLSGIESIWYQIDAGYWQLYSVPFTVNNEGQHTVSYYSFDYAGNIEIIDSVLLKIDRTAPTTSPALEGVIGSDGWYITNVTVTLSANDATSGVNITKYKLNDGNWILYTNPFIVETDGNYTLYYYSVDVAGNTEATKQAVFRIQHDVTPPVTTPEFIGDLGDNDWFVSSPVIVIFNAEDDSAGVDFTMYKLDAGVWTTYTGAFLVTGDGEHTLYYYSVDKVGNREENNSTPLKIDQTMPTINLTMEKTGLKKWLLTATVSDETSGVNRVEFYLDGEYLGQATETPYEYECTQRGTAQAIVFDNAGNSRWSDEIPVSFDLVNSQSATDNQVVSGSQSLTQNVVLTTLQRLLNL